MHAGQFVTCAHARPSRCSIATAWIVSAPVVLHSLLVSSSRIRTFRLPAHPRRTRFVPVVEEWRLGASVHNAVRPCSRAAMRIRASCPFVSRRWMIVRSFSRCWISGRPAHNHGFVLASRFLSIHSRRSPGVIGACAQRAPIVTSAGKATASTTPTIKIMPTAIPASFAPPAQPRGVPSEANARSRKNHAPSAM